LGGNNHRGWKRGAAVITAGLVALGGMALSPDGVEAARRRVPAPLTDADLAPHRAGAIIVGFTKQASTSRRNTVRSKVKAAKVRKLSKKANAEVLTLESGASVAKTIEALRGTPGVAYAEPDYFVTSTVASDDTYYTNGSLWGMYGDGTTPSNQFGSGAGEAWAQGYVGSRTVAIGVIDEGIQVTHPDLAANMWTNPNEIAGNNIDDDNNGYVDDMHGWDFLNNNASVFDGNSTEGSDTHGTHVAGTIGGIGGNGSGVAGVNWAVTMVSAKFLGPSGGYTSDAAEALDYLVALKVNKGLNIVATSNSWGGGGASSTLLAAINRAGDAGMLFVAAAGNSTSNNDATGSYPSNYECTNGGTRGWDCVIAVASITSSGSLSSFSSYGATTVDIAAPGSGINSTYPTNSYASLSGTSMATPHVSGAIALCASINPSLSPAQLREAVINSAQVTPTLVGKVVNAGRLDVGAMIDTCAPPTAPVDGSPSDLTASNATRNSVNLAWTDGASGETYYGIDRAPASGNSCGTFARVATTGANSTSFVASGLNPSTDYCFRVVAGNGFSGGNSTTSNTATARTLDAPAPYTCATGTYSWIASDGSATTYSLGDDAAVSISLPFTFNLYDTGYTTAQISSNGFLRLGAGAATSYTNVAIQTIGDPEGFIAPWWNDLNPGLGGTVWSRTLGSAPARQFVVTWEGIEAYGLAGTAVTFQVVLSEATGDVTFQYLDTLTGSSQLDGGASSTIGIEDADGQLGTQVGFNQNIVSNNSSLLCTRRSANSPVITTASLAAGTTGVAYSQTLGATSGTTPYTWSISSGSLPSGLVLDASTGVISGQPDTTGTSSFTVTVTDDASETASKALSITVANPVSITTTSLTGGVTGQAYSATAAATGGSGPYTWSRTSGSLPNGLSLAASTGVISGTPSATGSFSFTLQLTDSAGRTDTKSLSITVLAPPSITTTSMTAGSTGTAYSHTLAATSGTAPYTWSISAGSLPAGLTLDGSTGVISGIPTATGNTSFTAKVTDSAGLTATRSLTISVTAPVTVTTATLPAGSLGTSYTTTLAATGGTTPYAWSVSAGSLPPGLTLTSSTGRITGTPTAAGSYSFTVRAADSLGRANTKALSITISSSIPRAFNKAAPRSGASNQPRNGLVLTWAASVGAVSYEYCFDSTRNGTCNGTWVNVGTNRSVTLTGLGSKLSYEWQVRAVNAGGTRLANNGRWWRFTTAV